MKRIHRLFAAVALSLAVGTFAHADTVWVQRGGSANVDPGLSKVVGVAGSELVVRTVAGGERKVPLADVARLKIDGEDAFNAAEDAFALQKYGEATAKYQEVVDGKGKEWVRDFAAKRLLDAANLSGRFDAAVTAYIKLTVKNPAAAQAGRPVVPAGANFAKLQDAALGELNKAVEDISSTPEQKTAYLLLVVDIHRARNDTAGRLAALTKLRAINPAAVPPTVLAEIALGNAELELGKKDFAKAIKAIEDAKAMITDPAQQIEALYIRAEARFGVAQAERDAGGRRTLLLDAALDYARVLTVARDARSPRGAAALFRLGEVHELLGEPAVARRMYESLVRDYPSDPSAARAREQITKLPAAAPAPPPKP